ncbi:hypothetical protein C8E07_1396 [Paracidovorax citrulli]|nr:hypothetical protein C8E07_1396 [Paracidovorax citrulli]
MVAASHAGISREMWSKYEAGAEPGARVLAAVGAAGVDTQYVLTGEREGAGSPLTPEEQMLLSYFRDASKEVRKAALGALLGATVSSTAAPQNMTMKMSNKAAGGVQVGYVGGSVNTNKRRSS